MLNIEIDLIRNLRSFGGSSLAHEQKCSGQDDHQRDHDSLQVSHGEEHEGMKEWLMKSRCM